MGDAPTRKAFNQGGNSGFFQSLSVMMMLLLLFVGGGGGDDNDVVRSLL
jgi:hypothetical protein